MNYFLLVIIIATAGYAYYQHTQDEQTINGLQQDISAMQARELAAAKPPPPVVAPMVVEAKTPPPVVVAPEIKVASPPTNSAAVDAAAKAAAAAAADPDNLGTIATLDGRTFRHCRLLKAEADGVTFSHDDGITKILFPLLRPDVQKRFGYDAQQVTAEADAQVRLQQEGQAAPASPTNSPTGAP